MGGTQAQAAPRLDPAPSRVLFVTGRLAEPALRRTLADMAPPFAYDVAVLKITVAALMTTEWMSRFLSVPAGVDLVLIPGLCEGDVGVVEQAARRARAEGPEGPARDPVVLRPGRRRSATTAPTTSRSWPRSTTRRR